jgi:hypothetical protein
MLFGSSDAASSTIGKASRPSSAAFNQLSRNALNLPRNPIDPPLKKVHQHLLDFYQAADHIDK